MWGGGAVGEIYCHWTGEKDPAKAAATGDCDTQGEVTYVQNIFEAHKPCLLMSICLVLCL